MRDLQFWHSVSKRFTITALNCILKTESQQKLCLTLAAFQGCLQCHLVLAWDLTFIIKQQYVPILIVKVEVYHLWELMT